MNPVFARALVRLYPQPWRQRYGEELESLLIEDEHPFKAAMNIAYAAAKEHLSPTRGLEAAPVAIPLRIVAKTPTAIIPLILMLAALTVVVAHAVRFGVVHERDEGAAAHLWQLLIACAGMESLFFAVLWLPKAARPALIVLAIFCALMLANFAAVYLLT